MQRQFSGAIVRRVIDRSHAQVPEHAHDWPVLSLFVMGRYLNQTELGPALIDGPSAILYRARAAHRNAVGPEGFEQVEIEFDPSWLGLSSMPELPVSRWIGGGSGAAARGLARLCWAMTDPEELRQAMSHFLWAARVEAGLEPPAWIRMVRQRLRDDTALGMVELARDLGRHPSYVGAAYRRHAGEAPRATAARIRLERAVRCLRETSLPCATIAQEAGFCDQSHMNRTFRDFFGRSPLEVREDRAAFRAPGETHLAVKKIDGRHQWNAGDALGCASAVIGGAPRLL